MILRSASAMHTIYHFTTREEWASALGTGRHVSASLFQEGFIHCCTPEQIESIRQRFFSDRSDALLLEIDPKALRSQLVYEWSKSMEQTFPHIYGPINTDAVVGARPLDA